MIGPGIDLTGAHLDEADPFCDDDQVCTDPAGVALVEDAQRSARRSDISLALGLTAGAVAAVLWWTAPAEKPERRAVQLLPSIEPQGVGFVLSGRFD